MLECDCGKSFSISLYDTSGGDVRTAVGVIICSLSGQNKVSVMPNAHRIGQRGDRRTERRREFAQLTMFQRDFKSFFFLVLLGIFIWQIQIHLLPGDDVV